MATRAIYTFKDKNGVYKVYKHFDNIPRNACIFIENAIPLAWEFPRFEADEFACAFIAANKKSEGDIRLIDNNDEWDMGQDYEYIIELLDDRLIVSFTDRNFPNNKYVKFKDTLNNMKKQYRGE